MMLKKTCLAAMTAMALAACTTPTGINAESRFDVFDVTGSADFSTFERAYISPVTASQEILDRVGYRPRGTSDRTRPLNQRDIDRRLTDFRDDLASAVGANVDIVDSPGVGILTITVQLTGIDANRPTQADLAAQTGLSFDSVYLGGASATVTFAENGRILATAKDSNKGQGQLEDISPATWGKANQFFRRFANKIASLLG